MIALSIYTMQERGFLWYYSSEAEAEKKDRDGYNQMINYSDWLLMKINYYVLFI